MREKSVFDHKILHKNSDFDGFETISVSRPKREFSLVRRVSISRSNRTGSERKKIHIRARTNYTGQSCCDQGYAGIIFPASGDTHGHPCSRFRSCKTPTRLKCVLLIAAADFHGKSAPNQDGSFGMGNGPFPLSLDRFPWHDLITWLDN